MTKNLLAYLRVSTDDQGVAGNGLEAQRASILKFAEDNGYTVIEFVQEVASGKLGIEDRPVLRQALARALKLKVALVVSKLDRLSRQAAFILNLMNTKAKFIVAQFGDTVDEFMIHIYAVLGEKERQMIGQRTRDALAVLKAKGVKLGAASRESYVNKDGKECMGSLEAGRLGATANVDKADAFAIRMRPSIERMINSGMSMSAVAREFNANGTKTARGGDWTATTVGNMVKRWA
jgi:DNA invertase Pin-like site-specific DNA recombinase